MVRHEWVIGTAALFGVYISLRRYILLEEKLYLELKVNINSLFLSFIYGVKSKDRAFFLSLHIPSAL